MHTYSSVSTRFARVASSRWRLLGAALATSLLVACGGDLGEEKLKSIPPGANRDAVLSTLGTGPVAAVRENDQLRVVSGFRRQGFVTKARQIEVVWYREQPGSLEDPITQKTETPVVIEADSLLGWGWKFYHPLADSLKLPDPIKDAARIDSMSKAQQPKSK